MKAAGDGQVVPQRLPRMTGRQAQADAIAPLGYAATDLEQTEPQRVQLHPLDLAPEPAAQSIEQPIGGRMQQEPELVGPEAVVAETVGEAGALQVLDGVLAVAAGDVPGVEDLGRVGAGGDDEAGI